MLKKIRLNGVGPAPHLEIEFARRLNLLTGDNGLGKSFVLDAAWWVLTRTWARDAMAIPQPGTRNASIEYSYSKAGPGTFNATSRFDRVDYHWKVKQGRPPIPGIVIYAGVDGSFSAWDPARNYWQDAERAGGTERPRAFNLTPDEVWRGASGPGGIRYCNGLIHDWVSWQRSGDEVFSDLKHVLEQLSPAKEPLLPGEPAHIGPIDETLYPTLAMPYGEVPLIHASAGIRRICALAYLLVWTWQGHRRASREVGVKPAREIIFLVDELECHLHPRWQRRVVPALLGVMDRLKGGVPVQLIAATHSPLVLASVEPSFDEETDAVFHLKLDDHQVTVEQYPWAKQGDVTNWLVSEPFGLEQARSIEAEQAIEKAEALMRGERGLPPKQAVHAELVRVLASHDAFWPRWIVWTEKQGGNGAR